MRPKGLREKRNSPLRALLLILSAAVVFSFITVSSGARSEPAGPPSKNISGTKVDEESQGVTGEKKEEVRKGETSYTYSPEGKRDPFKPFISEAPVREKKKGAQLTPLQKYKYSQLKLIGIIWGMNNNVAMVEDPTGKGYTLKKGTLIGENDGKVAEILKDRVIVRELYRDPFGNVKSRGIPIKLRDMEEGEIP
ncbi:MAG: pilus assembly protein PilP [Pseudomonadota bacterium]